MTTATRFDLDEKQRFVVDAAADARYLVIAGAGRGKTEVVESRLAGLIERDGLSASTEILVLSFSRAAVHAVRDRVAEADTAEVIIRTFDSFASQLLFDADIEPTGSYDARIRIATALLRRSDVEIAVVEDLRHVVIDEVQDLVGDRAEFVSAVLDRLHEETGITALGDPLQGIYDFVLDESVSTTSFDEFYERLTESYGLMRTELTQNYRARGENCHRVDELAAYLRGLDDAKTANEVVRSFEVSLPHRDSVADWTFLDSFVGQSAVLCHTNAEVLRVSRALADQGIRHSVRRPAQNVGAARWIGVGLNDVAGPLAAQSDVESALARKLALREADVEDAWFLLKAAEGRSRGRHQLDFGSLRNRIRCGGVPLTLVENDISEVIVSTTHRAKGLEFDNVFILDTGYQHPNEDPWHRVRRHYVALSRARDHIEIVRPVREWPQIREYRWLPGRLQERNGRRPHTWPRAIEFTNDDVYVSRPADAGGRSASEIQRVLESAVTGTPVAGELDVERSGVDAPIYSLTLDGEPIGRTTEEFGLAFRRLFNLKSGVWPAEVADLLLVSVETTAGDPRLTEHAGIGAGGFWLVPRVVGLARPLWDVMEEIR